MVQILPLKWLRVSYKRINKVFSPSICRKAESRLIIRVEEWEIDIRHQLLILMVSKMVFA